MTIKINILELASELAELKLFEIFDADDIYVESDDEVEVRYTDEAQDSFNGLYDEYYNIISQFEVK